MLEGWDEEVSSTKKDPNALVQASRNKNSSKAPKDSLNKNSYIFFEGFPQQTLDS